MSIKVKSRPENRKQAVINPYFSWLNVVSKQKCIYVLGCKGHERYELFHSYLSPSNCLQEVWQDIRSDLTYVLYPSLSNELLVKRENFPIERLEKFADIDAGAILLIPVEPTQLPNGCLIVLPPPIFETELTSVMIDPLFRNQKTDFVWVEAFPYGKSESFNALNYLEKEFNIFRQAIHFAFIESQRNFSYTDLDTEQEAMDVAKKIFQKQGFKNSITTVQSRLTSFALLSLITEDGDFSEGLLQEMDHVLKLNNRYFERFFEDDYLDFVVELRLPTMLELVFDFQSLRMVNKKSVFDIWLHNLEEFIKQEVNPQIQRLLIQELQMDTIYPIGNYQADLLKLLETQWSEFVKKLGDVRIQSKGISKQMDHVEYATAIKDVKVQIKQKMTTYIEKYLFDVLYNHISYVYRLWDRS
jgi:hypothetical protein